MSDAAFAPLAPSFGEISGGWHRLPLRVIYADTDAGGVVYHANYLNFAERARTEMLRAVGIVPQKLYDEDGTLFVVRSAELDYRAPARLDDALELRSRVVKFGGASLEIEQQVLRWEHTDSRHLVTILVRLVCVDPQFNPQRVPDKVRVACAPFYETGSSGE